MGLQLCAPLFEERLLLGAAHAYEQKTRHAGSYRPALTEAAAPSPIGTASRHV